MYSVFRIVEYKAINEVLILFFEKNLTFVGEATSKFYIFQRTPQYKNCFLG
jgi:hypothetical protein